MVSFVSIFWYNLNGFLNVENVRQFNFFPAKKAPDDSRGVVTTQRRMLRRYDCPKLPEGRGQRKKSLIVADNNPLKPLSFGIWTNLSAIAAGSLFLALFY